MSSAREQRMREVLRKRQFNVAVVLENVWDPHNISAVLRSCDATGIQDVYIISDANKKESKLGRKSSASASKWISIYHYTDVKECFAVLKKRYGAIYATQLSKESVTLYDLTLTGSVALVFGNEKDGVSEQAAALADGKFIIPQVGMIQSLNISVACAVTLYECYRQRKLMGLYDQADNSRGSNIDHPLLSEWKIK